MSAVVYFSFYIIICSSFNCYYCNLNLKSKSRRMCFIVSYSLYNHINHLIKLCEVVIKLCCTFDTTTWHRPREIHNKLANDQKTDSQTQNNKLPILILINFFLILFSCSSIINCGAMLLSYPTKFSSHKNLLIFTTTHCTLFLFLFVYFFKYFTYPATPKQHKLLVYQKIVFL